MLFDKIKEAEKTLQLAAEISRTYYHAPLIICYSGGKDSDVLLDIAVNCLSPDSFMVQNSHTTVDAPETVYHIRDVFKELNQKGISTEIRLPRYKGKPTSMWQLIVDKGFFPTRRVRYCCEILKENGITNRIKAVGVREDESRGRQGRGEFGIITKSKNERLYGTTDHVLEQFKSSLKVTEELGQQVEEVNAYDCRIIENAKKNRTLICNPIYYFKECDIWEYIRVKGIKTNPLYQKGYARVGCVGCPLAGPVSMKKEFADYPKYKENYIKAFDRMLEKRRKEGKPSDRCKTGEDVMKLWLCEDPTQISIEEYLKNETEVES